MITGRLAGLLLAIFSAIVIISLLFNSFENDTIANSIKCETALQTIASTSDSDITSDNVKKILQENCDFDSITIYNDQEFSKITEALTRCWEKGRSGNLNVFEDETDQGQGLCIHCAEFKTESASIEFKENFLDSSQNIKDDLTKSTNNVNLNNFFIYDEEYLPEEITSEAFDLVLFMYKPTFYCEEEFSECVSSLRNSITRTFSDSNFIADFLSNSLSARNELVTGMFFTKLEGSNGVAQNELELFGPGNTLKCSTLIANKVTIEE